MAYRVSFTASHDSFEVTEGQTVLDAALAAGYLLPYGCRDGACGACKARIVSGQVRYTKKTGLAISSDEERAGWALLCRAEPCSDLVLEVDVRRSSDPPIQKFPARLEQIEKVGDVAILTFKLPASLQWSFRAGQYVDVLLADGSRRSFSIASSPSQREFLELHIRLVPGGRFTSEVFDKAKPKDIWRFEGPLGSFGWKKIDRPAILVAGGTGFAPIQSMLLALSEQNAPPPYPISCYVGARTQEGLYRDAWLKDLAARVSWLRYVPVLSEAESGWNGRRGLVHRAVLEDYPSLSGYEVYVCGAPAMVEAAYRDFLAAQLEPSMFHADAFTFQSSPAGIAAR